MTDEESTIRLEEHEDCALEFSAQPDGQVVVELDDYDWQYHRVVLTRRQALDLHRWLGDRLGVFVCYPE